MKGMTIQNYHQGPRAHSAHFTYFSSPLWFFLKENKIKNRNSEVKKLQLSLTDALLG
jgi:hypothetical protein